MVGCLLASCVNDVWMLRLPGGGRHWARKLKLKKHGIFCDRFPEVKKIFLRLKKYSPSNQGDKEMWMFCGWPGALWEELSGDSRIFLMFSVICCQDVLLLTHHLQPGGLDVLWQAWGIVGCAMCLQPNNLLSPTGTSLDSLEFANSRTFVLYILRKGWDGEY